MPRIEVDDEVFARLQDAAVPLVDTPNTVLRRLVGLDAGAEELGNVSRPTDPQRSATPRASPEEANAVPRRGRKRLPRGLLLPEVEYERPILETLIENGGSAAAADVLDAIGLKLQERLTDADYETLRSGDVRWRNRAQWARNTLVKRGCLDPEAPWGVWRITPRGRREVASPDGGEARAGHGARGANI